jgi:hypothetical protein
VRFGAIIVLMSMLVEMVFVDFFEIMVIPMMAFMMTLGERNHDGLSIISFMFFRKLNNWSTVVRIL